MRKTQGEFPLRLEIILNNVDVKRFANAIGYSLRMVQGWRRGEFPANEKACRRIEEKFGYNFRWLMTGEGEPYTDLVAAGSAEEYTRDADADGDADLPLDYWRDRSLLERWIAEEDAIVLYRITREELHQLENIPILGFEDHEENYGEIFRMCLLMNRKKKVAGRKTQVIIKKKAMEAGK